MNDELQRLLTDLREDAEARAKRPLAERIAEAKAAKERQAIMEADSAHTRELLDPKHITSDMSTAEKLGAGFQAGLRDVGRNVGNIVGLVSDEDVKKARKLERALRATGAGQVGAFAGEAAALAPVSMGTGALAKAGSAAAALGRSRALPSAVKALGTTLPRASGRGVTGAARAALEGGAAGAILAGPDNRLEGAKDAALTSAIMNKTAGSLARKFGRGFDESDAAKEFTSRAEQLLGYKPKLPVTQSAKSRAVAYPHRSILSMFPLARGGSKAMEAATTNDYGKAVLVQTFGVKNRDAVFKAIQDADGDLVKAGHELLRTMGRKGYAVNKKALKELLDNMKAGQVFTPNDVDRAAKKLVKGENRPFYELTSTFAKVMEEPLEESTVSGRRAYNKAMNKIMGAGTGAGAAIALGGVVPYLGITGATRAATSAPVQNFMMGRTMANRGITNTAESIYAAALRNALAADEVE